MLRLAKISQILPLGIVLSLSLLSGSVRADGDRDHEGTQSGGGGGSIVCFYSPQTLKNVLARGGKIAFEDLGMDKTGKELPNQHVVESIEAYDLYEARLASTPLPGESTPIFDILQEETF